jgi:uncharacterized protein (TIGR03382 family)
MRSQIFSLGVAGLVAASFVSFSAHANSRGIDGRSGKQGPTCMASGCHATNSNPISPTVELDGPRSLTAGATGNYTLIIRNGAAVKAGMNVAVSDNGGTLNAGGPDQKILNGELTHSAPKDFNSTSQEARFDFSLVAPATAGNITIYASGNSANGNANNPGDSSATTTLSVEIKSATSNPDAGTGNPDAGTGNPGGGNGDGDKGDDGGCAAAGGPPMVLLLALIAARLRRRRA